MDVDGELVGDVEELAPAGQRLPSRVGVEAREALVLHELHGGFVGEGEVLLSISGTIPLALLQELGVAAERLSGG